MITCGSNSNTSDQIHALFLLLSNRLFWIFIKHAPKEGGHNNIVESIEMSKRPTDCGEREDEKKLFLKSNRNLWGLHLGHSKTNSQNFFNKQHDN